MIDADSLAVDHMMRRTLIATALIIAVIAHGGAARSQTVIDMTRFLDDQGWTGTWDGPGYPDGPVIGYHHVSITFETAQEGPGLERVFVTAPPEEWAAAVSTGQFSVRAEMLIQSRRTNVTDPTFGICEMLASTGSVEFYFDFFEDRVELRGNCTGTTQFAMDTTDAVHVYEIFANGPDVIVWVDGVVRIDATSLESTTAMEFSFGDMEFANFGESEWFALSFGPAGVVPTRASSLSNLKSNYRQ